MISQLRIQLSHLFLKNEWGYPFLCSLFISLMSYRDINSKYILAGIILGYTKFFIHDKKNIIRLLQFLGILFGFYFSMKEFGTIFHIEGGFSFIMVLSGLKLLETRNKRDLYIYYNILFLVTCSQVIFVQSFISSITSLLSILMIFSGINFAENKSFNLPKMNNIFNFSSFKYIFLVPS